jgi:hypothetical protein
VAACRPDHGHDGRLCRAPYPKLQAALAAAKGSYLLTFDFSNPGAKRFYQVQAGRSRALAVAAYSSTSASDNTRSKPSAERSRVAGTMATPWARRPPPWT